MDDSQDRELMKRKFFFVYLDGFIQGRMLENRAIKYEDVLNEKFYRNTQFRLVTELRNIMSEREFEALASNWLNEFIVYAKDLIRVRVSKGRQ
jgi:hypothetical protein